MSTVSKLMIILLSPFLAASSCMNSPIFNSALDKGGGELDSLDLPPGFQISYFAKGLKNARSMTMGADGTIYVGTRTAGNVYALQDKNGDFKAEKRFTLASGLNMPNGVAIKDGDLYVAEVGKVWKYPDISKNLSDPPTPQLVSDTFPTDRHHGWKYINFGPDGKLYVPVGAPCNICKKEDPIYSSLTRMDPNGENFEIYAHGIRNTVGFDWEPSTGILWFTDNGRDNMGDNIPMDELNRAPQKGMHFGYPFCHEGDVPDPKFGDQRDCEEFTAPAMDLGPHVAALGMEFYTGDQFPSSYKDRILICQHGSWNRSEPIGYRVVMVTVENGEATQLGMFATGWLNEEGDAWGRPVDVLQLEDGSVLISDDFNNCIYRIHYEGKKSR